MKKTLLITGASGFIGSNFIKKYENEYNIIPVCLIEKSPEELDFTGVDSILHLAALVHQMKGAPEERYFEINTELTRRLAVKAKEAGVKHFVFYSTVKVYGFDGDLNNHDFVLTENSSCNPNDPYGASKYEAEKLLKALEDESFKVATIRPPMVYGEGVKGNMLSLIKLMDKLPIIPLGYDKNRRSVISTANLLYMTHLIIQKSADGIYLGTEGNPVSIKEIATSIQKGLGKNRINIELPKFVFKILCKVKPDIMVRLFGTLAFRQEDNYIKIGYKSQDSMDNQIKMMIGDYANAK
ncbi:NAD-dependent epimerase/dehydratase family protein [Cetobacterium sp. ZOR0034]|uniref:NAD-dependent epimerase/dehydratase family protein n=1 Tax=Cetobacterium sp. ZOR0034 TaxID=1339239 RepID=UPI0006483C1A|nr:NAD-dependent epimerase/dehydratase family protein [Cetobacterium sp. ZOR0034]